MHTFKTVCLSIVICFLFIAQPGHSDEVSLTTIHVQPFIENGSPLNWEITPPGEILISLLYDHERFGPNRAAIHWHFLLQATPGSHQTLILQNFNNIWNGRAGSPIKENTPCFISKDGKIWSAIPTMLLPENRLKIELEMPGDSLYVARLEPYRMNDLQNLLRDVESNEHIDIMTIGKSVQGRDLWMIRVGKANAPHRVLIRGRAHAWEPGGNWVIEGLIRSLLMTDPLNEKLLKNICFYIMPMANIDGVAQGRTRFNLNGMDLNRNWDKPADPQLAPENAALETFIEQLVSRRQRPDLVIDFHNDSGGKLHIARPNRELDEYLQKMARFEDLLTKHTWFTEGSTGASFRNPGSIGEGLLERYGIPALVYELNANWIAGRQKPPLSRDWLDLGRDLRVVFIEYFQ